MNVNILISMLLNISDAQNINGISLADTKNVPVINLFIEANITKVNSSDYTSTAKVTALEYQNDTEVIAFKYKNVSEATASDDKNISKVSESDGKDISKVIKSDNKNISKFSVSDDKDISKAIESDDKEISKVTVSNYENVSEVTVLDNETIRLMSDKLYDNIVAGKYDDAVSMSMELDNRVVVTEAVTKLIDRNANNTIDYAYRLWTAGGKDTVTQSFPPKFKAILNGDPLTITSKNFGSALTLSDDFQGDQKPKLEFRDINKVKASWKLIPVWENDNSPILSFKIKNIYMDLYLYVSWLDLGDGQRGVWANKNAYTEEHLWYLKPVARNMFKIINRKFAGSLSFKSSFETSEGQGWIWVTDEEYCKGSNGVCQWSYEWFIAPLYDDVKK